MGRPDGTESLPSRAPASHTRMPHLDSIVEKKGLLKAKHPMEPGSLPFGSLQFSKEKSYTAPFYNCDWRANMAPSPIGPTSWLQTLASFPNLLIYGCSVLAEFNTAALQNRTFFWPYGRLLHSPRRLRPLPPSLEPCTHFL